MRDAATSPIQATLLWVCTTIVAVLRILTSPGSDNLLPLPVLALLEHLLGPLHVEGAAHSSVGGEQIEDAGAVQGHSLPRAPLQHSFKLRGSVSVNVVVFPAS